MNTVISRIIIYRIEKEYIISKLVKEKSWNYKNSVLNKTWGPKKNQQERQKEQNKMADLNPKIWVVTLSANGLSAPFQNQRLQSRFKNLTIWCLQEMSLI